jgi:cysteine desulfurase
MAPASPRLNLDAARSPGMTPAVWAAMRQAGALYGNPNSVHGPGHEARRSIEQGSRVLADWAGLPQGAVVYMGSLWEAHLSVLRTVLRQDKPWHVIWVGRGQDSPNLAAACAQAGITLTLVAPEDAALSPLEAPNRWAHLTPALLVVDAADGRTGAWGPVSGWSAWAQEQGCPWVLNGGMAAPYLPHCVRGPHDPAAVILEAGPLGGPAPWVAVIHSKSFHPAPLWPQSGAADAQRPGTAPRDGVAGFAASVGQARHQWAQATHRAIVRDALDAWACTQLGAQVVGVSQKRLPHMTAWRLSKSAALALGIAFTRAHSIAAQPQFDGDTALQTLGLPSTLALQDVQRLKDALF